MALDVALRIDGQTAELSLSGELDARTAPLFLAELERAKVHRPTYLCLQVRDLEYLGCAGLRAFIFFKQQMGRGVEVHVVAPRQQVLDTLKRAGLLHSFTIVPEKHTEPPQGNGGPRPAESLAGLRIALEPLIIPATLDALESIGQYVKAAAGAAGLDTQAAYRLRLAVEEIATNVAMHGSTGSAAPATIALRAEMDARALGVILEDTGRAFDPRQAPPPDLDPPSEERKSGGLGVYLAREGVDEFAYERVDGRNRHVFTMKRPVPGA
jgi:anti-anti-sigma factor